MVARYCDPKDIKTKIKARVFWSSRWPLEISVDRTKYCDPRARANLESKEYVTLEVSRIRNIALVRVKPDKPPPEHAEIVVDLPSQQFATKDQLRANADEWATFIGICDELAKISERGR